MKIKKLLPLFFIFFLISVSNQTCLAITLVDKTIIKRRDFPAQNIAIVTADVPGFIFDLEGLTSPSARVEFFSTEGNINLQTVADNNGVFHFKNVYAPSQTGEFCFISYDINYVANNPLCFSAPPPKTKTTISGIILSPTLWLSKSLFHQNELVSANGRTFPNAELAVYFFEQEQSVLKELLDVFAPQVFARQGPKLTVNSDNNGNFSFNLPTHKSNLWRLFIGPKLENQTMTAKSNTLEFMTLASWQFIVIKALNLLLSFFNWLKNALINWWALMTILLVAIIGLIIKIKQKTNKA